MYICVLGVSILPLSTIFLFDFVAILKSWGIGQVHISAKGHFDKVPTVGL
jgi:dissimilatory sulfite reductase (desulfoviridin) alpha/beta subunit